MSSYNLPLLSIPAYYFLAIYPHAHAVMAATGGDMSRNDNRNPRGSANIENFRKTLSPQQFAAWERTERCHANHMENMPLYVSAVMAGLLAQQKGGLEGQVVERFCAAWLVTRILYTISYIRTDTKRWSHARSMLYFLGTGLCFRMFWQAAKVLA